MSARLRRPGTSGARLGHPTIPSRGACLRRLRSTEVGYASRPMSPGPSEGLRNEALHAALNTALAGKPAALEELLCRYGGYGPRPNLRLAAAFGAEMTGFTGVAAGLLDRLGGNDAAPDTPEVFLPVAAAHGWVGRLRANREIGTAWDALAMLAGDERAPVRLGTLDALTSFVAGPNRADALLARAAEWLEIEDREIQIGRAHV